jgi:uncharacterized protein YcgI (DUF1989 family)
MKIEKRLTIKPQTGIVFTLDIGKSIRVIDVEGQQVADLIAVNRSDAHEMLSTCALQSKFSLFCNHTKAMIPLTLFSALVP